VTATASKRAACAGCDQRAADAVHDIDGNISCPAAVPQMILSQKHIFIERMVMMSRLVKVIRSRREILRTRRELNRAIANASSPAMRDELILVAQRGGNVF
jgi:hypothetical protein